MVQGVLCVATLANSPGKWTAGSANASRDSVQSACMGLGLFAALLLSALLPCPIPLCNKWDIQSWLFPQTRPI